MRQNTSAQMEPSVGCQAPYGIALQTTESIILETFVFVLFDMTMTCTHKCHISWSKQARCWRAVLNVLHPNALRQCSPATWHCAYNIINAVLSKFLQGRFHGHIRMQPCPSPSKQNGEQAYAL